MGVSGASEQTTQLGLYKWEDGPDRYNHTELYQNWDNIDLNLLRKRYSISGDEATQIVFGAVGTASLAATALVVKTRSGTVDTQDRFNLSVGGSMSWGLGTANVPDTFLYRSGSAALTTNGSLTSLSLTTGQITSTRGASSEAVITGKVTGDSNNRVSVDAGGVITWGSGGGAGDTNLYRVASNELKTDDNLTVGLGSIKLNDYPLYRSGSGTVTAGGNVKIDGNLVVGGNLTLSGSAFQGAVNLDSVIANNMLISANGTVANLIVSTSAVFNSTVGNTDFPNGFNINGINITNAASVITVAGALKADTTVSSTSRTIANSGSATQVAIGSLSGTAAISFGNGEDAHIRRSGSNALYTPGNFTIGGDLGLTGLNINNPASTTQQVNINGDIWLPDGGDIFFGNTSKSSGAGNRMVLSYSAGNGFIDVATGSLSIRNNSLGNMLSVNSSGSVSIGAGLGAGNSITVPSSARLQIGTAYFYHEVDGGSGKGYLRTNAAIRPGPIGSSTFLGADSITTDSMVLNGVTNPLLVVNGRGEFGSVYSQNFLATYPGGYWLETVGGDWIIQETGTNLWQMGWQATSGTLQPVIEAHTSKDVYFGRYVYAHQFNLLSSRKKKDIISQVKGKDILDKIKVLPLYNWTWKDEEIKDIHTGPIAEEFNSLFYGREDESINATQAIGISLAAIKALADKVTELENKLGV